MMHHDQRAWRTDAAPGPEVCWKFPVFRLVRAVLCSAEALD